MTSTTPPPFPAPLALVARTGTLHCRAGGASIVNDVGGTTGLPVGTYRVRLLKTYDDYETGKRCMGELMDAEDIALARVTGTTGHSPEDYRKYGPERYLETLRYARTFDPKRVYFALCDFTPD